MARPLKRPFLTCTRGGAAVEFAILAPALLALVAGGVFYSRWFTVASQTQNLASDGARAAVAGLNDSERLTIVTNMMTGAVTRVPVEKGATRTWRAWRDGDLYAVSVTTTLPDYDLAKVIPMPDRNVTRQAIVVIPQAAG
jgi:Flp pilus assembly protein TadG